VTCRNTLTARVVCEALFAPSTWSTAGTAGTAEVSLTRGGRVYGRARAVVGGKGRTRLTLRALRRVRPGAYLLTIRTGTHVVRRAVRIG
jgi:hypothetical protein